MDDPCLSFAIHKHSSGYQDATCGAGLTLQEHGNNQASRPCIGAGCLPSGCCGQLTCGRRFTPGDCILGWQPKPSTGATPVNLIFCDQPGGCQREDCCELVSCDNNSGEDRVCQPWSATDHAHEGCEFRREIPLGCAPHFKTLCLGTSNGGFEHL